MDKGILHDGMNLFFAIICCPIYILHLMLFLSIGGGRLLVISDLDKFKHNCRVTGNRYLLLLYFLHNDAAFRKLFYHRFGILGFLISWIRPGLKSLLISRTMSIGEGCYLAHPLSTILTAQRIGKNFSCMQLTTLGKNHGGNPVIGDNVSLGANVTIIGPINIGNNVTVGAGSVVVKDIPNNCVVAGVPARIIKRL